MVQVMEEFLSFPDSLEQTFLSHHLQQHKSGMRPACGSSFISSTCSLPPGVVAFLSFTESLQQVFLSHDLQQHKSERRPACGSSFISLHVQFSSWSSCVSFLKSLRQTFHVNEETGTGVYEVWISGGVGGGQVSGARRTTSHGDKKWLVSFGLRFNYQISERPTRGDAGAPLVIEAWVRLWAALPSVFPLGWPANVSPGIKELV